jgi:hypothetical protein
MRRASRTKKISKPSVLGIAASALVIGTFLVAPHLFSRLTALISGVNINRVSPQSAQSVSYLQPHMVRIDAFPWDIIEATKGAYDFTVPDTIMSWVRTSGQSALGIIQYAPGWANGQDFTTPPNLEVSNCGIPDLNNRATAFNKLRTYPPRHARDFGAYAGAIAKRYRDVQYWQIWNEPNNPIFWPTGPDARKYTDLLKTAAGKIRTANPQARIVLGGISLNDLSYIQELYDASAQKYFDILAVHLYNPAQSPQAYLEHELEKLHTLMAKNDDSDTDIWLTEIGWHTGTGANTVTEHRQARYFEQTIAIARQKPYVGAVFWNTLMDCAQTYDAANPEHNYGLFNRNLQPKKSATVMRGMMLNNTK